MADRSPAAAAAAYASASTPARNVWAAAAVAASVGVAQPVLDDDERVGARDDRIGRVGETRQDRLDRAAHDLDRDERPDRVVDHDDVVARGVQGGQTGARALVARGPTRDHGRGDRQARGGQGGLGLGQPGRVGHDDEPVDPGRGHAPGAAHQDGLAGQAHELLGDVRAEAIAIASGEQERVDPHRSQDTRAAAPAALGGVSPGHLPRQPEDGTDGQPRPDQHEPDRARHAAGSGPAGRCRRLAADADADADVPCRGHRGGVPGRGRLVLDDVAWVIPDRPARTRGGGRWRVRPGGRAAPPGGGRPRTRRTADPHGAHPGPDGRRRRAGSCGSTS